MRWLLLINLLAVVLLSGAVAIVLEGTPVGIGASGIGEESLHASVEDIAPADLGHQAGVQEPSPAEPAPGEFQPGEYRGELELSPDEVEGGPIAAPGVPRPLPAPRETVATQAAPNAPQEMGVATVDAMPDTEPELIEAPKPLKIATEGDFAPFNFLNEKGEASGFDVDVAKELCRRLEQECTFETKEWADLVPSLRRGDVDLIAASMQIPSARPAGLVFSDPYYGSRGRFVVAQGSAIAGPGVLQTSGAQIAVQQGSLHEAYLRQSYEASELVPAVSIEAALRLVADGKVEAAFGDNTAILQWIKKTNCCAVLEPAVSDTEFFGDGVGLVLRDDNLELTAIINKHLQEMISDGTSATLSERYFGGSIY